MTITEIHGSEESISSDTVFDAPLSDTQMTRVLTAISSAESEIGREAAVSVYAIVAESTGWPSLEALADAQPSRRICSWQVRLPELQWSTISEAILARARAIPGQFADVDHLLDWVNLGPWTSLPG